MKPSRNAEITLPVANLLALHNSIAYMSFYVNRENKTRENFYEKKEMLQSHITNQPTA